MDNHDPTRNTVNSVGSFFRERWQFVLIVLLAPLGAATVFTTLETWSASFVSAMLAVLMLLGVAGLFGSFDRGSAAHRP